MTLFGKRIEKGRVVVEHAPPGPVARPNPGTHTRPADVPRKRQVVYEHGPGLYTPVYRYEYKVVHPEIARQEADLCELSRQGWDVVSLQEGGLVRALCRRPIVEGDER